MSSLKRFVQSRNAAPLLARERKLVRNLAYFTIITWDEGACQHSLDVRRDFYRITLKSRGRYKGSHAQYDLVFVQNVQFIEPKQVIIPAQIRFGVADCLDDLFSGDLYFSTFDRLFKSIRFLTDRELHSLGAFGVKGRHYLPDHLVKSRPEVMDGITDHKGELWWNGFVLPELKPAFSHFGIFNEGKAARVGSKKGRIFSVKVDDMLFRTPDF